MIEQQQNYKPLILTLVLSMLVLFLWQHFYAKPKEQAYNAQMKAYQQTQRTLDEKRKTLEAAKASLPIETTAPARRIPIKTPSVQGSINLKGARLDDLQLLDYKRTGPNDPNPVELLSPTDQASIYFAEFGWISNQKNVTLPTASTVWSSEDAELTPAHPVTLTWKNNTGTTFKLHLAIDSHYMFTVTKEIVHNGNEPITLASYGILNRNYLAPATKELIIHTGPLAVHNGVLSEYSFNKMSDTPKVSFTDSTGWVGFTDKYWFTSIIPSQDTPFQANLSYYVKDLKPRYQVDYTSADTTLAPNSTHTDTVHFFAGAKQVALLDAYSKEFNIPLFDRAVDFGWLYFITKPIFLALTYFHTLVGNFGVAILLLTVCIKTLLFPLAYKSYLSMHKMKQFQPQIVALRERYADNKMLLNKEMMALYKREKINPASGCLPILLQIPIFFALYRVLLVTIEMRHAPFFGWIHDLSAPDPTSIFNLFGLLPYSVPPVFQLGVWPLVMGLTMYLQQRFNPQPTDPIQAKIFKFFPFVFTFMLYRFPAGLVIYWAWNNTLTIIQQQFITFRLSGAPKQDKVHG